MTTVSLASAVPPLTRSRLVGVDRLRGAAIALMIADHLLIVSGHWDAPIRHNVTRAAMPVFAIVAGALWRRMSWRWLGIAAVGFSLMVLIPWAGEPNILLLLAIGAVTLWCCQGRPLLLALFIALPLTRYANSYPADGPGYDMTGVIALMCLGQLVSPLQLDRLGSLIPRWLHLEMPGRWPLSVYVGHLAVLDVWWLLR